MIKESTHSVFQKGFDKFFIKIEKFKNSKGSCSFCSKVFVLFRKKHFCTKCNITLCSDCIHDFESPHYLVWDYSAKNICSKCLKELEERCSNYKNALNNESNVKIYPHTYEGPIPTVKGSEKEKITTKYWKDRDDALKSLKVSASYINCNLLFMVKQDKVQDSEGNYIFHRYRYSGFPAIKK